MKSKNTKLNIYMNGRLVGLLEKTVSGSLFFSYAPSWIENHSDFPISRKLPVRERKYQGDEVGAYFDNLLPDNKEIRERLAEKTESESAETFDLLSSLGRDCVGALQFQDQELPPPELEDAEGHPVSDTEVEKIIKNLHRNPLGITKDDFRLSLAGAQEKTALLYLDGKWQKPIGATATTHIFKPQIGKLNTGVDLSQSVENEWLCLEFCREMGLRTTKAGIKICNEKTVLVVERFDREWQGRKLFRLPQEDLCQALGTSPVKKYENHGGPGMRAIMELLDESDSRDPDRAHFLKTQVVYWLLAAIDGHAKNFSLALRPGGFALAPNYDVLSADPIVQAGQLEEREITLAMCVGKGRHYKIFDIQRRHWLQTAKILKYSNDEMERILTEVFTEAPRAIERLSARIPKTFPTMISESILEGIRKRLQALDPPLNFEKST